MTPRLASALSVLAIAMVSGCGAGQGGGVATEGKTADQAADKVQVAAAFYPLQLAAEQVGGEHVTVTGLTKPGAEPHDLELSPKDVAQLAKATLVIYEKGFQPAVDEAVTSQAAKTGFDVSPAAELDLAAAEEGEEHGDEHGAEPTGDHAGESPEEHAEHAGQDPHFWLDPTKYAAVATAIGERLAKDDPAHAGDYQANAKAFADKLTTLDSELKATLATCTSKDLVTSHAAFGYLAKRYGLHQEGIAGISPDAEPNAAQMKEIVGHIKEHGVKTVYSETLVSPALADTIAKETGAQVAVLDPIEGVTSKSAGKDYFEIMRSNLTTLAKGQGCA